MNIIEKSRCHHMRHYIHVYKMLMESFCDNNIVCLSVSISSLRSIFCLLIRQESSCRRGKALNTRAPLTNRTTTAAAAAAAAAVLYRYFMRIYTKHTINIPSVTAQQKKIYKIRRTTDGRSNVWM